MMCLQIGFLYQVGAYIFSRYSYDVLEICFLYLMGTCIGSAVAQW